MNNDFEKQLASTPRRVAPLGWRANILATAQARSHPTPESEATGGRVLAWLQSWLGGISPAWRALAAVWALCVTVSHFTDPAAAGAFPARSDLDRVAPEQIAAARAQRAELLRFAGFAEREPVERPPTRPPGPRGSLNRPTPLDRGRA